MRTTGGAPYSYVDCKGVTQTRSALSWRKVVQPYIKSAQIFRCPSNPRSALPATSDDLPVSYAASRVNFGLGGPFKEVVATGVQVPVTIAVIDNTTSTIIVLASTELWNDVNLEDSGPTNTTCKPVDTDNSGTLFSGHMQTGNFLFVDGHVKSLRPLQTLSPVDGGTSFVSLYKINQGNMGGTGSATTAIMRASEACYK